MPEKPEQSTSMLKGVLVIILIISTLATAFMLFKRINTERANIGVDLVVDYNESLSLAGATGTPLVDVLKNMHDAGASTVALQEETLLTLESQGEISFGPRPAQVPEVNSSDKEQQFTVTTVRNSTTEFIMEGLKRVYHEKYITLTAPNALVITGARDVVRNMGLGLSPERVATIKSAGLRVVPRLRGGDWMTSAEIVKSLEAATKTLKRDAGSPPNVVIFDGKDIPGYKDQLAALAEYITTKDDKGNYLDKFYYGAVELGKQRGDMELGTRLQGHLVRVHSISTEELSNLTPQQAVARFTLAVKDRNIRVLYAHYPQILPLELEQTPVKSVARYINAISEGVKKSGFVIAQTDGARPFRDLPMRKPVLAFIFLGAGAAMLLWFLTFLPAKLPEPWVHWGWRLLIIGTVGAAAVAFKLPDTGRTIFGLLAATGFPLIGLSFAYREINFLSERRFSHAFLRMVLTLILATFFSLIGGLFIAAMFAETRFLVKVTQFTGVKATLIIPLLLFALLVLVDGMARAEESFTDYIARCKARLMGILNQPIYVWWVLLAVVALGIFYVIIARSGNDSAVAVSSSEIQLRGFLERMLNARPRSKEFAFGHPAFLISLFLANRGYRNIALIVMLAGVFGQMDIVNTYCHEHTPVLLSMMRTFNGWWLGAIIGVIAIVLLGMVVKGADAKNSRCD